MKWKPPEFDRSVEQWSDREIEFEQMRANWAKVEAENSPLRRYAPIILSAFISLLVTGATVFIERRASERSESAQQQRWDNERASNALRLFFENPDLFAGKYGAQNLELLKQTTPAATMASIQRAVDERANSVQLAASAESAVTVGALPGNAPVAEVARKAEERRYETIASSPSRALTRPNSAPGEFTIYLQYGAASGGRAQAVQTALAAAGYKVPTTTQDAAPPVGAQVRYYLASQSAAAQQLAASVATTLGVTPTVRFVGAGRTLPDGILEVWLPAGLDGGAGRGVSRGATLTSERGPSVTPVLTILERENPRTSQNGGHAVVLLRNTPQALTRNQLVCEAMLRVFATSDASTGAPPAAGAGTTSMLRPVYWPVNGVLQREKRCPDLIASYDYTRAQTILDKFQLRERGPYLVVLRNDEQQAAVIDMSSLTSAQVEPMVRYFRDGFSQQADAWSSAAAPASQQRGLTSVFGAEFSRSLLNAIAMVQAPPPRSK